MGSVTDKIMGLLESNPDSGVSVEKISENLNITKMQVSTRMKRILRTKRIRRYKIIEGNRKCWIYQFNVMQ